MPMTPFDKTAPMLMRWTLALVLLMGIFFRVYHLDYKVFWVDEAYTALRMSGYTEAEFVQQVFTGDEVTAEDLQRYQTPNRPFADTLTALRGNAEHAPLYFVLARLWTAGFGSSVAALRSLSVLFSLLVLPALYWLGRELFDSSVATWATLTLVAVSPLHVLYAQEARQYSLWTLAIALSCASLLWALRSKKPVAWVVYAATAIVGWYSHLLFGLVAIAHALYVAMHERGRFTANSRAFLLALGAAIAAFVPWLVVVVQGLDQIGTTTAFLTESFPLARLVDFWFLNLNRVFVDRELGAANLLLVLLVIWALWDLWRQAPRRTAWFILLLIGVPFLLLLLPDLLSGGQRSLRIRYLIPCFLGLQMAIAHLLTSTPRRTIRPLLLAVLLAAGIYACTVSSQAQVWWNKSSQKSAYFPPTAEIINQTPNPRVISDFTPINLLSFSHLLQPQVRLRLLLNARMIRPTPDLSGAFLLNPSKGLRDRLSRRLELEPRYAQDDTVYLWQLK